MAGALSYQAARAPRTRGVPALGRYARRYGKGGEVDDTVGYDEGGGGGTANTPRYDDTAATYVPSGNTANTPRYDDTAGYDVPTQGPAGPMAVAAKQGPVAALRNVRSILAASNGRQPVYAPGPNNLPVPPVPPDQPPPDQSPAGPMTPTIPDSNRTGGNGGHVNMPLLMAAAGMLKGGHPGGFGADLGYGLEEGGKALEAQRRLEENAELRKAQQANTAAYQKGMLAVNQQKANTGDDRAAAYGMLAQAHAMQALAKATAGAGAHTTPGDLQAAGIKDLMTQTNDKTGKPYTLAEATMLMTGALARNESADANTKRANTGQQRADDMAAYRDRFLELRKLGLDEKTAHDQAMVDLGYVNAGVHLTVGNRDPLTGKPLQSFGTSLGQVRPNGGMSPMPAAAPNGAPPPGLPPTAKRASDGQWYVPNPTGGWLLAVPGGQ